jgi:hypothetical protein
MRGAGWIAVGLGLVTSACGRSPLLVDDGQSADDRADGADDPDVFDDGNDDRDDDDDDDDGDDGSFVPPPDVPGDTEPDPSCGNGVIDPGELCYLPRIGFPSRIDPCALAIGDLNDDGHLDVVVPNSDFGHVEHPDNFASVLLGDGTGVLGDPIPFLAGGDYAVGISIADLDNDGRDDLVVANNEAATLNVLRGVGPADFGSPSPMPVGDSPVMSALADLDQDGFLDVATTINGGYEVYVARGRGDGTFHSATTYGVVAPWELVLADLDGDGIVDMAANNSYEASVKLWRGAGDGNFFEWQTIGVGVTPLGLAAADLDGDGRMDLLSANQGDATIWVYLNDGSTMTAMAPVPLGYGPRSIAVADLDMDGRLDIAVADDYMEVVHVAVGDGKGELVPAALYGSGVLPSNVRVGDLNEDGVPDLLTSDQLSNEVGVILSNP